VRAIEAPRNPRASAVIAACSGIALKRFDTLCAFDEGLVAIPRQDGKRVTSAYRQANLLTVNVLR
jgi:hypothetical protein